MKQYVVYFYIKANRTEYLADVVIEAPTAKAACTLCKAYDHFLRMPYNAKYEHRNVTTKLLYNMAQAIMQYSDPETYDILEVTGIMYCLAKICFTTFYTED